MSPGRFVFKKTRACKGRNAHFVLHSIHEHPQIFHIELVAARYIQNHRTRIWNSDRNVLA